MRLDHLLARQAGVLTTPQAVEAGISARTVRRRVQRGEWQALHPGVFLVAGHRLTDEARVRAAWLWAGRSALVSGPAAAYWYRMLDRAPEEVEVTVPRHRHLRPEPGVVLRRRDLSPVDRVVDRHLALTAEPLTALETAVAQPGGSVFLDRALQRHVRFPALYRAYCRNMGRRGSSRAGQLIAASADRADSAAERLLVSCCATPGSAVGCWGTRSDRGGSTWPSRTGRWRSRWTDGRGTSMRNGSATIAARGNAITRGGWNLLRYTWHALDGDPAGTVEEIAGTLSIAA